MEILVASAKVKPAVNQILFHPYVQIAQTPIIEFAKLHNIVIEGYSLLLPITQLPGGALDTPLGKISARLSVTPDQVLMAWAKTKDVVVVTTSSKEERLKGYLAAADLNLTSADIAEIDLAGAAGPPQPVFRNIMRRVAFVAVAGVAAFSLCTFLGVDLL